MAKGAALVVALCILGLCSADVEHDIASAEPFMVMTRGRWDHHTSDEGMPSIRYDWPLVTFDVGFTGTKLELMLRGGGNHFNVYIDGAAEPVVHTTEYDGTEWLVLAEGLAADKNHVVRVVKRTEAKYEMSFLAKKLYPVELYKLRTDDGSTLVRPDVPVPARKTLWVGDSDTAAFGVEGGEYCLLNKKYENAEYSFGAVISSYFDAEPHFVCISGYGVRKNAQDILHSTSDVTMVDHIGRTVAADEDSHWNPKTWVPDAVFVRLGSNDYQMHPFPTDDEFKSRYHDMVAGLIEDYPGVPIVNLCGDAVDAKAPLCSNIRDVVENDFKDAKANGKAAVSFVEIPWRLLTKEDKGCLDHQNIQGQKKMADHLVGPVATVLGWSPKKEMLTPNWG